MPELKTVEERRAEGRARRADVPRSSHAGWQPPADRPDPVALLEDRHRRRVRELVPIRVGRMLVSPFTFLRGAAEVMAHDLASTPTSGLRVQACGDAHLLNFGVFATPERHLVFDVNDFDETLPAPWEWDVKRLAASVAVAGAGASFAPEQVDVAVASMVRGYRVRMQELVDHGAARRLVRPRRRRRRARPGRAAGHADAARRRAPARTGAPPHEPRRAAQAHRARRRRTSDHRGPAAHPPRPPPLRRAPLARSTPTSRRSPATAARCSTATGSSTPPARSSAWAASGPAVTSSS